MNLRAAFGRQIGEAGEAVARDNTLQRKRPFPLEPASLYNSSSLCIASEPSILKLQHCKKKAALLGGLVNFQ